LRKKAIVKISEFGPIEKNRWKGKDKGKSVREKICG